MTPQELRVALKQLGLRQTGLARLLIALGDDRPYLTVLRQVQAWTAGDLLVPPTLAALLVVTARVGLRTIEAAAFVDQALGKPTEAAAGVQDAMRGADWSGLRRRG